MKLFAFTFYFTLSLLLITACDETSTNNSNDPNVIGGETDIELTEVGNDFGIYLSMDDAPYGIFENIKDTCYITKNENGIVTFKGNFTTNEEVIKRLDTLLGIEAVSKDIKHAVADALLERFGATIDTTDKENLTLDFEIKGKITSEGIQDFIHCKGNVSKPFTLIKYNAKVGDKYTFTMDDGTKYTREVIYKSTDDDFPLGFINIKVMKVEEVQVNDPLMDKILYYTNHKFGLVGIEIHMKNGKIAMAKIMPWAVLN